MLSFILRAETSFLFLLRLSRVTPPPPKKKKTSYSHLNPSKKKGLENINFEFVEENSYPCCLLWMMTKTTTGNHLTALSKISHHLHLNESLEKKKVCIFFHLQNMKTAFLFAWLRTPLTLRVVIFLELKFIFASFKFVSQWKRAHNNVSSFPSCDWLLSQVWQ